MAKLDGTNGLIQQYDYQVLTTAFTYTFASGTQTLVINPAGTLATGTITMPVAPADGMSITIESTQTITAITVQGNTGQSIVGAPTQILPNQPVSFIYRVTNTTWYPLAGAGAVAPLVSGTAQNSTSGTSIDFTSIPSWVKRITMVFNGVSVSTTQVMQIQLGTGGSPTTSGYVASAGIFVTGNVTVANSLTTGFAFNTTGGGGGTQTYSGLATFVLISGNTWICSAQVTDTTNVRMGFGGGTVSLAGTLNMVRLTTIGGTDTFDAGSVNIMYE
jgi:hypothetical protein